MRQDWLKNVSDRLALAVADDHLEERALAVLHAPLVDPHDLGDDRDRLAERQRRDRRQLAAACVPPRVVRHEVADRPHPERLLERRGGLAADDSVETRLEGQIGHAPSLESAADLGAAAGACPERHSRKAYGCGMVRRLLARLYWACSRWRLVTTPAPTTPTILIGAPHTSNWDFVLMLAIAWRLGIPFRWLGKDSLFRGWRGPLMRGLGGIPVDRADASRVVGEVVERIRRGEVFGLVVTPEGTRGSGRYWKSGFYRIAREAGLPVTLGYVDRTTMTTGLGITIELTGDVSADMERIRDFYADKAGLRPALRTTPRLREEDGPATPIS